MLEAKHRIVPGLAQNVRKGYLSTNRSTRYEESRNRASKTRRWLRAGDCVQSSGRPLAVQVLGFLVLAECFSVPGPF
jgi:hypothetical protein